MHVFWTFCNTVRRYFINHAYRSLIMDHYLSSYTVKKYSTLFLYLKTSILRFSTVCLICMYILPVEKIALVLFFFFLIRLNFIDSFCTNLSYSNMPWFDIIFANFYSYACGIFQSHLFSFFIFTSPVLCILDRIF